MKYLFFLVLSFSLLACTSNSDNFIEFEELGSITAVDGPETVIVGQQSAFVITYRVPENCYSFQRLDFSINGNERVIAVVFAITDNDCTPLSNFTEQVTFDIQPEATGVFIFKFFSGNDPQGQPTFITKEVTVTDAG